MNLKYVGINEKLIDVSKIVHEMEIVCLSFKYRYFEFVMLFYRKAVYAIIKTISGSIGLYKNFNHNGTI